MIELNAEKNEQTYPYKEKERDLLKEIDLLFSEIQSKRSEISTLQARRRELGDAIADITREVHELKHEMCVLNPAEKFVKKEE